MSGKKVRGGVTLPILLPPKILCPTSHHQSDNPCNMPPLLPLPLPLSLHHCPRCYCYRRCFRCCHRFRHHHHFYLIVSVIFTIAVATVSLLLLLSPLPPSSLLSLLSSSSLPLLSLLLLLPLPSLPLPLPPTFLLPLSPCCCRHFCCCHPHPCCCHRTRFGHHC